ncbi:MAG: sodium:proton antiporter NhaD [Bernardetiaceae bacterium]
MEFAELLMLGVFIFGYLLITLEHNLRIDKASPALMIGGLCWAIYMLHSPDTELVEKQLHEHLSEISGILFFLLSAMTIVELIDAHDGFTVITKRIETKSKRVLLWLVCIITFFLSAALDNLASTIVMVSVLRKLIPEEKDRMLFVSMIVISANAGGAWSPIGDVTTTMLWIGGHLSTTNVIKTLIIPSIVALLVPLSIASFYLKGSLDTGKRHIYSDHLMADTVEIAAFERRLIFIVGLLALIAVPFLKTLVHLPPFMGITLGLGVVWLLTEVLHKGKPDHEKGYLSVMGVLQKVDVPSVLFFFGILMAVAALQSIGLLRGLAEFLDGTVSNIYLIGYLLGLLSAIVDNVPLVAASIGMYDLSQYPMDHPFWEFIAYCAGTGGSTLIIGSAAGVAAMGMEHIRFGWYLKNIAWKALVGYTAGAIVYIAFFVP